MKVRLGDKITLKSVEKLEDIKKVFSEEQLKKYKEKFAGKTLTVSNILKENPIIVEFEEDEDDNEISLTSMFIEALANFESPSTKKHHFSELYFEKIEHVEISKNNSFGWALEQLKEGKKVAREGWNGKGMWLELQKPDAHSKMTLPYLYLNYPKGDKKYHDGCRVPWLASQTDLLENDWGEVE